MQKGKARSNAKDTESVASYDSTGRKKSFRRLFTRFAEKTSCVGVPYINMARFWWAKAIWVFLLLAAMTVMTLHLWYLFDQYYSWPKSTKVQLGFETLAFPQVTICNTNILHKTRFNNYNGAEELKWLVSDLDPENFVSDQFADNFYYGSTTPAGDQTTLDQGGGGTSANRRRKRYVDQFEKINTSKYDPDFTNYEDDFLDVDEDYISSMDYNAELKEIFTELYMNIDRNDRNDLGHQISDMLIECSFNRRKCTPEQFKLHQTSEYGNCWTLHDRKFRVKKAGPQTGLSLILFLETDEYLKGITTGYGIRISIQEANTYPSPADKGYFIPASMETDIGLQLKNITRLGGNYGSCNNAAEFTRLYNMTYSRRACQAFCQISTVIKNCSCFDDYWEEFAFTRSQKLEPCRSETEMKCLLRIENLYYNRKLTCTCDNPCSEVTFSKSISQRQWPSNEYARVLLEWVCDRDIATCKKLRQDLDELWTVNNNFLKLNIYYEDLNFENITETAEIEIQQFLSDVGGAIGLWIGLSILSLCEIVQLIVELCYYGVHKAKNERGSRKNRRETNGREDNYEKRVSERGNNRESSWRQTTFGARNGSHRDPERSGYFSDNGGRHHRRYYESSSHYETPRDRFSDSRDRYDSSQYDRPDIPY